MWFLDITELFRGFIVFGNIKETLKVALESEHNGVNVLQHTKIKQYPHILELVCLMRRTYE